MTGMPTKTRAAPGPQAAGWSRAAATLRAVAFIWLLATLTSAWADDWRARLANRQWQGFVDDAMRSPDFIGYSTAPLAAGIAAWIASGVSARVNAVLQGRAPVDSLVTPRPYRNWERPPEEDPLRLTTYPDFPDWAMRTWEASQRNGTTLDPETRRVIVAELTRPGGPGLNPDTYVYPPSPRTVVLTGQPALNELNLATGTAGGRPVAPANYFGGGRGILGAAYTPGQVGSTTVMNDPLAIVKETYVRPGAVPTTLTESSGGIAGSLATLGLQPGPTPGTFLADDLPANVNIAAFSTTTVNGVKVIDVTKPFVIEAYNPGDVY